MALSRKLVRSRRSGLDLGRFNLKSPLKHAALWIALAVLAIASLAHDAAAAAVKLPYTEIHEVKLDNGLRALIVETPRRAGDRRAGLVSRGLEE